MRFTSCLTCAKRKLLCDVNNSFIYKFAVQTFEHCVNIIKNSANYTNIC